MKHRMIALVAVALAAVAAIEVLLRAWMFKKVSYSNSRAVDLQLQERNSTNRWSILFLGDSEVRWGVNPAPIEAAFARRGSAQLVFNHALDGFGASWWSIIYPRVVDHPSLANVRAVGLGVQLVEVHRFRTDEESKAVCGALQRPILTSSYGKDLGLNRLCEGEPWYAPLQGAAVDPLWLTRYRSSVKALVWGQFVDRGSVIDFNSARLLGMYQGFEPHRSIAADAGSFEGEFSRWKAQFDPSKHFKPLDPKEWDAMVAPGGYFDRFVTMIRKSNKEPFFFALPTNPLVIDTFKRRGDYERNSAMLSAWAKSRGIVYVDLGILDRNDAPEYFSDMRHLSAAGAADYSGRLGEVLAAQLATRISNNSQ